MICLCLCVCVCRSLRYGHVLIMADQDEDGSHIKGLVINFFNHYWPSLMKLEGYIQQFATPLAKVSMVGGGSSKSGGTGSSKKQPRGRAATAAAATTTTTTTKTVQSFYSKQEFERWLSAHKLSSGAQSKFVVKYYKVS